MGYAKMPNSAHSLGQTHILFFICLFIYLFIHLFIYLFIYFNCPKLDTLDIIARENGFIGPEYV